MAEISKVLNCAVVDDEPLALALLTDYIAKVPGLYLVEATSDPIKALNLGKSGAVELIFLDMQMPELNGLQFMRILQKKCRVIITTAYTEYALEGYEHHVIDYLLKPIMLDRFMIAAEKAQELFNSLQTGQDVQTGSVSPASGYIFVKTDYRIVKIDLNDIYYLEGARDYVIIHTVTDKILTLQSMKSLEEQLPKNDFVRVHKSYVIALNKIIFIERGRISINQQLIPVSDTYRSQLYNRIKM